MLRPFNSISVISGRWAEDNERLCATGIILLKRSRRFNKAVEDEKVTPRAGLKLGTTRSVDQHLTHSTRRF